MGVSRTNSPQAQALSRSSLLTSSLQHLALGPNSAVRSPKQAATGDSVKDQIQKYLSEQASPVPVVGLGNLIVVKADGNRTSVFNHAQSQATGRQKLLKYLRSIPGLKFSNTGLSASVSFTPPLSVPSPISLSSPLLFQLDTATTPISAFMQLQKQSLKRASSSKEYLEFLSPPVPTLSSSLKKQQYLAASSASSSDLNNSRPRSASGMVNASTSGNSKAIPIVRPRGQTQMATSRPPAESHWFQPANLVEFQR